MFSAYNVLFFKATFSINPLKIIDSGAATTNVIARLLRNMFAKVFSLS